MEDFEAILARILYWLFAGLTMAGAFLIADRHLDRKSAIGLTVGVGLLFVGLFWAVEALLRTLGL